MSTALTHPGKEPQELIEILQDVQTERGFLPEEVLRETALRLSLPLIEVFRVANFYKAFTLKPRGKYLVTVCMGTACHVRGSQTLADVLLRKLGICAGDTTPDNLFTVETVNCVGACALGPVVIVNGRYYDHMTASKAEDLVESLSKK